MEAKNDILLESLEKFCTNTSGECKNSFFEHWFTNNGKTYNFIFKQNLFVTNIQFRELVDLIRLNVRKDSSQPQINFMTTHEFFDLTSNIIESFIDEKVLKKLRRQSQNKGTEANTASIKENLDLICKNYRNLFENIIVIDAYYTSCIVSIPPSLEVDIQQICLQSGYIHSCGENIYTRNMKKAKVDNLIERLEHHLKDYTEPLNFIMYTHEDFPIKNKLYVNDFQRHGLDEIKFYLEKFYMQDISLMQVVEKLKSEERLKDKIKVIKKAEAKENPSRECIWMIIDRSIGSSLKYPGEERYYICYKQMYINENPFHIFDENKPGWINSVTIPHTLVGAMLNIGRSECHNNGQKKYTVIDPFVGSGTTYLESLKYNDITFEGSDKCQISQIITQINLRFFALKTADLKSFSSLVFDYIKQLDEKKSAEIQEDLKIPNGQNAILIRGILSKLESSEIKEKFTVNEDQFAQNFAALTEELSAAIEEKLDSQEDKWLISETRTLIAQIFILLIWKTYRRNEFRYDKSKKFILTSDSTEEFKGFLYRLSSYIHLRDRSYNKNAATNDECPMIAFQGKYTTACTINHSFIGSKIGDATYRIKDSLDVRDFLQKFSGENAPKVDLIVTDPPYGFNTKEDKEKFSNLYIEFISAMVKAMNNGGQIIMCLPSISYSGKAVNVFAQKEIVSRQFMIAAQENNMIIAENGNNFPNPKEIYSFPFYWDSEKALRRDIVRFQFFKKD